MSYFKRFPLLVGYRLQDKLYDTVDITKRTAVERNSRQNPDISFKYNIVDGETPEILADRVYDDIDLYWVILVFNNILSVEDEWPLDQISFDNFIKRVYGDSLYNIRYYRAISTGLVVEDDYSDYDKIPVTNYEHELEVNDKKRNILMPHPKIVGQIVSQHQRKII